MRAPGRKREDERLERLLYDEFANAPYPFFEGNLPGVGELIDYTMLNLVPNRHVSVTWLPVGLARGRHAKHGSRTFFNGSIAD